MASGGKLERSDGRSASWSPATCLGTKAGLIRRCLPASGLAGGTVGMDYARMILPLLFVISQAAQHAGKLKVLLNFSILLQMDFCPGGALPIDCTRPRKTAQPRMLCGPKRYPRARFRRLLSLAKGQLQDSGSSREFIRNLVL